MVSHIVTGFANMAIKSLRTDNHKVEVEARRRLDVCGSCSYRMSMICSDCGCYLPAKARSNKECKYWKNNDRKGTI